ncbi:uncharacterized protein LOC127801872 [Diospyros lotus]|uniref:uncharacterized protein LOC127801872 n=1 Tax=Diospyros lotus TaxID=55363 RepID=UPI002257E5DE|nr:uncharacterized protein LOC127801872 [Diospyros lotus]XP_052193323.1 uncharacterized protein LOC127801872 [Diospyros lotus]
MEGKSPASCNLGPGGGSFSFLGLQGSNQQESPQAYQSFMALPQQVQDAFPFRLKNTQECDQSVSFLNYDNKVERAKNSGSDDDDESNVFEEAGTRKKDFPWQRVKWTDKMVKLLITAVSYIGEEATLDCIVGGRRSALIQKKGKWKSISKVMAERGHKVSPQQCEDKFNDLNKRYKRLNDILGKGTSCKVVENPSLLDLMDLSDKAKDDVRKILSSKQLFYEEMCSYHNGNRLYLPHDRALQHSLRLALKNRDNLESRESTLPKPDDLDEDDQDAASDDQNAETEDARLVHYETEEGQASYRSDGAAFVVPGHPTKRRRQGEEHKASSSGSALDLLRPDHHGQTSHTNANPALAEGTDAEWFQNEWLISRSLQLEEQKLQIQAQMLELEKQRFKWQRITQQDDRELEKMRLENECLKLENQRLAFELKRREMGSEYN